MSRGWSMGGLVATIDSASSEPSGPPPHPETTTATAAVAQAPAIVARPRRLSWILMAFSWLDSGELSTLP
jgi:hypothetical protein